MMDPRFRGDDKSGVFDICEVFLCALCGKIKSDLWKEYVKMRKISLLIFLSILIICPFLYGATTGKIAGQVTDQDNGQPLPGVNVYLEGTSLVPDHTRH